MHLVLSVLNLSTLMNDGILIMVHQIKTDDVPAEDGGLLHVLPLPVHLNFFDGQVGWTILDHSYFLNFFVGPLLHA